MILKHYLYCFCILYISGIGKSPAVTEMIRKPCQALEKKIGYSHLIDKATIPGIEQHHCDGDPAAGPRVYALCAQDESSVVLNQFAARDAAGMSQNLVPIFCTTNKTFLCPIFVNLNILSYPKWDTNT